jgi:hypothetical protein
VDLEEPLYDIVELVHPDPVFNFELDQPEVDLEEPAVQFVQVVPSASWVLKPECRSPYPAPSISLSNARTTLELGSPIFDIPYELSTDEHVTVGLFLEASTRWQAVNRISEFALGQMYAMVRWAHPGASLPSVKQINYLVDQVMEGTVEVHDACPQGDCVLFRNSEFEDGQQYNFDRNGRGVLRCPTCGASRHLGESGGSKLMVVTNLVGLLHVIVTKITVVL